MVHPCSSTRWMCVQVCFGASAQTSHVGHKITMALKAQVSPPSRAFFVWGAGGTLKHIYRKITSANPAHFFVIGVGAPTCACDIVAVQISLISISQHHHVARTTFSKMCRVAAQQRNASWMDLLFVSVEDKWFNKIYISDTT